MVQIHFHVWICGGASKWYLQFPVLYCIRMSVLRNSVSTLLWAGKILVKLLPKISYSHDFRLL